MRRPTAIVHSSEARMAGKGAGRASAGTSGSAATAICADPIAGPIAGHPHDGSRDLARGRGLAARLLWV